MRQNSSLLGYEPLLLERIFLGQAYPLAREADTAPMMIAVLVFATTVLRSMTCS